MIQGIPLPGLFWRFNVRRPAAVGTTGSIPTVSKHLGKDCLKLNELSALSDVTEQWRICVVIPALNEAGSIGSVVASDPQSGSITTDITSTVRAVLSCSVLAYKFTGSWSE